MNFRLVATYVAKPKSLPIPNLIVVKLEDRFKSYWYFAENQTPTWQNIRKCWEFFLKLNEFPKVSPTLRLEMCEEGKSWEKIDNPKLFIENI